MTDEDALPLYRRIHLALARSIETGELAGGQRLTESQLARHFDVSREPARRALRSLCEEGLLESNSSRRGFVVKGQPRENNGRNGDTVVPLAMLSGLGEVRRSMKWAEKYDEIKADLLAAASHGDFRIVPARLAEQYQISRTVLLDIQVRLIADGFVRLDGQKWFLNRFDAKAVADHFAVRMQLEPYALKEGFGHIDQKFAAECLEKLREADEHLDGLTVEQLENLESDLHEEMLSPCGNPYLMSVLRQSRIVHVFNSYYYLRFRPSNLFTTEHIDVFKGIVAGKPEVATQALLVHLENSCTDTQARLSTFAAAHPISDARYLKPV